MPIVNPIVGEMKTRMTLVEEGLSSVNRSVVSVTRRLDHVDERLDRIEKRLEIRELAEPQRPYDPKS